MATSSGRLPFGEHDEALDARIVARDQAARERAVDPRFNVALEASAGTGKTRVLVDRYINLLRAGIDPANILAITFTRKAAAEMRDRIMATLRTAAARGEIPEARWRDLRDRTGDIAISTIDAFCLSLLREFPLEADVDPGFAVADDTELPRLIGDALDRTLRTCRVLARDDENVALVLTQLGERRARAGLATLLDRRLVAPRVLSRYLARGEADIDGEAAGRRAAVALMALFESMREGLDGFIDSGPLDPAFALFARSLRRVAESLQAGVVASRHVRAAFEQARSHFLTQDGYPRSRSPYPQKTFANATDWRTHSSLVVEHAKAFAAVDEAFRRDLNVLFAHGIWRMFRVAESHYRRTLEEHALLDFSDLVQRALHLLRRMDEFSRSRYRLESRYHHVLVDEFQDTSRAQWELVSLLVQSWGEGAGLAGSGPLEPSIFIVGDRKQSIYGFRDADVSVLREAARHIEMLRPDRDVRRSISRSFRARLPILAFVNDIGREMAGATGERAFHYEETDRFPLEPGRVPPVEDALNLVLGRDPGACAEACAAEIVRLLATATEVRDRDTGLLRPVRPGDIAILFRSRESHREFEAALAGRHVPSYVYKGLGFFDADEIKDGLALIKYLAEPDSDLRAAALMRSRFVGLSDEALRLLAPRLADALMAAAPPRVLEALDRFDRAALTEARASTARWRHIVDRTGPAELVDLVLTESAYAFELRGSRLEQARENLKKLRSILRRLQNRGYATMSRVAEHLDRVAVGDEANAVIDVLDAVNLMTVHAAKGLEFPVVFIVNLARGTGNRRQPVRWSSGAPDEVPSVAVGEFQAETDDEAEVREREETKRLVYVALTRARDRIYLATSLKEGRIVPTRGSLAEVMPRSFLGLLAAGMSDWLEWHASSGAVHRFRVCPTEHHDTDASLAPSATEGIMPPRESDLIPLVDEAGGVRTVASAAAVAGAPFDNDAHAGNEWSRLVGTLVHRMLQRLGFSSSSVEIERQTVLDMLRTIEVTHPSDDREQDVVVDQAVAAYRAISARADVRDLYGAGERLHEVPFTMRIGDRIVRGAIDCLVRTGHQRMTVLEFKTGRPRQSDQGQVDLYRRAAEGLFPGMSIDARLVYAAPV